MKKLLYVLVILPFWVSAQKIQVSDIAGYSHQWVSIENGGNSNKGYFTNKIEADYLIIRHFSAGAYFKTNAGGKLNEVSISSDIRFGNLYTGVGVGVNLTGNKQIEVAPHIGYCRKIFKRLYFNSQFSVGYSSADISSPYEIYLPTGQTETKYINLHQTYITIDAMSGIAIRF
jgi:hypothetical protein